MTPAIYLAILSFVGNKEYHKVSDEFEIGPDLIMDCGVEHLKKITIDLQWD